MIAYISQETAQRMEEVSRRSGVGEELLLEAGLALIEWLVEKRDEGFEVMLQDTEGGLHKAGLSFVIMNEQGVERVGSL